MLSQTSKVLIAIMLLVFSVYIIFMYSPFEGYDLFRREQVGMKTQVLKRLPTKGEDVLPATTTAVVKLPPEEKNFDDRQTSVTVPKVTENKKGVYEVLETTHSDTDDSYRPVISPCVTPMKYTIGSFDPRFNITKEKFLEISKEAAKAWEQPVGTSLFTYDPQGKLKINLVYDERQATTVNLGYLALEIENSKQTAENIRKGYESEKVSYTNDSEAFNIDAKLFQERYAAYNDKVKSYNDKGGASQAEYDVMMKELDQLKTDSSQFETRRQSLLMRMETINTNVTRYNELVSYINTLIKKSNTIGSRTFTEGKFTPAINTIDIYQYADETKLKRVLMHEFGHVIGIGHVKNVLSIMYSFNSGTSTNLSEEDITALKEICASY